MQSNNSFKPNLLRYTNNVAEKACHVVGSATQVGLTQVLGLLGKRSVEDREKKAQQLPGRLIVLAIVALVVGLLSLFGLVVAFRSNSLWGILLLPLAIPAVLVTCAIIVRQLSGKGVGDARIRAKQA